MMSNILSGGGGEISGRGGRCATGGHVWWGVGVGVGMVVVGGGGDAQEGVVLDSTTRHTPTISEVGLSVHVRQFLNASPESYLFSNGYVQAPDSFHCH